MDLRPHLTFRKSTKKPFSGTAFPNKVETPNLILQANRLTPKIQKVEKAFAEYAMLTGSTDGLVPEKVLVLEIAGEVARFGSVLSKVPGFEFLAQELQESNYESEEFFRLDKGKKKPVERTAYLAMSSQDGLKRLLAFWEQHKSQGLPAGKKALGNAFNQLIDLRVWDVKDRLDIRDSDGYSILTDWKERIEYIESSGDDALIPFEAELWYRGTETIRRASEQRLSRAISLSGGNITRRYVMPEIGYHTVIGNLPVSSVSKILSDFGSDIALMQCDDVMFFRPVGQCTVVGEEEDSVQEEHTFYESESLSISPVVALLDGLPLENHEALRGRIIVDDPDDYESGYDGEPKAQIHGTSMASLIIHGDLNYPSNVPLPQPLYVRPIMQLGLPDFNNVRYEGVPEDELPLDLVHRAVKRMKEGEAGQPPTAPNIKVINLSVGERQRLFDRKMSPWARMLDWLSYKFDVLFVVSAGNMTNDIQLSITESEFNQCSDEEKESHFFKALARQQPERRMRAPAEAINALTVRSSHDDGCDGPFPLAFLDFTQKGGMPSPINPISLGRRNSIKPEVMMPGGRQLYRQKSILESEPLLLSVANSSTLSPGVKSAHPGSSGSLNSYLYSAGTSNAAALTSRRLGFLYETLTDLKSMGNLPQNGFDSVLLKAMLCHGAQHHPEAKNFLSSELKTKLNSRTFNSIVNQFVGFGAVDEQRIHGCISSQATMIGTGLASHQESHTFTFPLPGCLAASTDSRRLVVTVAWLSPINVNHNEYRGAQLQINAEQDKLKLGGSENYHHHLKHGTVDHRIFEGNKAAAFIHGDDLSIEVKCNLRAGFKESGLEVPFAIIATLDSPNLQLPIYDEVSQLLKQKQSQGVDA
ncbi:S8 family peptidase [Vibrio fluvialis]|nr:S8 family peptidase [Vibrio fluvialis]